MANNELEKSKQKDYYKILLPEVPTSNINQFVGIKEKFFNNEPNGRVKLAITLPDIDKSKELVEDTAINDIADNPLINTPQDISGQASSENDDEKIELLLDIADIKNELQNLEREVRINDSKEEILGEVNSLIKDLRNELEELKSRKVPARKEYETESSYKEQLYPQAIMVLDDIIVPLIDAIPDYSLIATQISSTFDDGTIKNGIVSISISISNNNYRHDFKVDVPVLNGLLQAPLFLTRGRKIIPLTAEALYEELNSESFIQIAPTYKQKDNMFSNVGENILKQPDNQKLYPTYPLEVDNHGKPLDGTWMPNVQRGI